MYSAYEYVVGFLWGEEEEPEPVPEDEEDSLDGSISGGASVEAMDSTFVIRKSTTAAFKSQQSFKAVPSMIIKAPEPKDNYDASVIAVMLTPAGLVLTIFGSIITALAYTTLPGFKSEDSVAVGHYGFPVKTGGPLLILLGAVLLILAVVVLLCTPHRRQVPMLYPQTEDEEASPAHPIGSRHVSMAPIGTKVTPMPASSSASHIQPRVLASGANLVVLRSSTVI